MLKSWSPGVTESRSFLVRYRRTYVLKKSVFMSTKGVKTIRIHVSLHKYCFRYITIGQIFLRIFTNSSLGTVKGSDIKNQNWKNACLLLFFINHIINFEIFWINLSRLDA